MQNNCSKEVTYAGFWVRLAAYLIDSAVLLIPLLLIRLIVSGITTIFTDTFFAKGILFDHTLADILVYLVQVFYFVLCTYQTGTTLGKKAMNLRVVSVKEKENLSFLNVLYRETIGRFLSGLVIGLGYLLIGIDKEKRGIHDMLCDTRVVYAKKVKIYPEYVAPRVQPMQQEQPGQSGQVESQGQQVKQEQVVQSGAGEHRYEYKYQYQSQKNAVPHEDKNEDNSPFYQYRIVPPKQEIPARQEQVQTENEIPPHKEEQ
ncbi:MAG: RDD family protein [Dorea sp.]